MKKTPIILLVSERSGSNLLRTLLGKHKDICAPVAPHLISEFYDIRKYYGDIRVKENSQQLLEDMLMVANHPFHDWNLKVKAEDFKEDTTSIIKSFDAMYTEMAIQNNKHHYCSKGIHSFKYIDAIRSELKDVVFIHMVREPKDYVASWLKRPLGLVTAYDAVQKWKNEQEMFIDAITTRGLNCISVKYEDLISNTKKTMIEVLDSIGVEVDENCFTTNKNNEESERNPYWENLSKPILNKNAGKYKKILSSEEILIIESIAKNEMIFFNYSFDTDANWKPNSNDWKKLKRKRKIERKKLKESPVESMDSLKDKWSMIKKMQANIKNKWKRKNKNYFDFIEVDNLGIRKRLKYILVGVLGSKFSNKIIKNR